MNICHVITRLIIGGAQENTLLTCRGLSERGHDVTLIAGPETGPEGSLWDQTEGAAYETIKLNSMRRAIRPLTDWQALCDLRRLFREFQPDIVHTHSSKAGILARRAALHAGVPTIVHTIHGMSFNRTQSAPVRTLYRFLERRTARCTSAFISVADAMTRQAVAAKLATPDRFTTIRSGMELEPYTPSPDERTRVRTSWGVREDDFVVGTIARLFDNKGYDEIIAAMPTICALAPKCRFVWIGDGARRSDYERRLSALGLGDRSRLIGLVPPGEVPRLINGFDVLVHASRWEGLPRAVVQALLMEVPAVSFDNDGAPEVVRTGETGILVRSGDLPGLAHAVASLAGDSELRRTLGRKGRERCQNMFDWRTMVDQIEALYDRLRP